ncbi:hypothetical protein CRM22_007533 [Opisthorchis felineus]|uniref:G-protein coupled receptors family 1 profile domain-containing protein n=1 Tax=Opisthorchis felineus TaxID=147828 RepID=A0A4S2LFE6_OPIFE|nr:hypothetical protein CRM22_007533 [Opisthorchis felineus]
MDQAAFVVCSLISNLGFVGTILNTIQIYVLCQCNINSRLTTLLLRTQSVIDAYTCLMIFISKLAGPEINTGSTLLNQFFCYLWFGDNMFWLGIAISVQNLTCISFDRFCAVCFPRQYKVRQTLLIIGCYLYEVGIALFLFIPNFFMRRFKSNKCYAQYAFDGVAIQQFFEIQAYLWMLFNYLFPAVVMISSHAYVIYVIRHPSAGQQSSQHARTNVKRLILTTSMMAGFLLALHSYESIRYILAHSEVFPYAEGSAVQQVGALLITLSSVLNPCVLTATSHTVRRQVIKSVLRYDDFNTSVSDTTVANAYT